jgi:hypothetical protein
MDMLFARWLAWLNPQSEEALRDLMKKYGNKLK